MRNKKYFNLIKKVFSMLMCICVIFVSCACENEENPSVVWRNRVSWMLGNKSYRATIMTQNLSNKEFGQSIYAEFNGDISHIIFSENDGVTEDTEVYYTYRDEDGEMVCRVYAYAADYEYWVGEQTEYLDNYFYAYSIVEEIRKLGAYVDMGELVYDAEQGAYVGENFSGPFVYDGIEHHVKSMTVTVSGERIVAIDQVYTTSADSNIKYHEVIEFTKIGDLHFDLPRKNITYEDAIDLLD